MSIIGYNQGIFNNVWKHIQLSQLERGPACPLVLCVPVLVLNILKHKGDPPQHNNYPTQISIVPRLKNHGYQSLFINPVS